MMKEEPDFYKREEDRKWRERTDERINSLTTSDTVQNDRIDQMEESDANQDKIVRGDPDGGILQKLSEVESGLRRLNAVLWPDATGNSGLINDVRKLKKNEDREEKQLEYRWKFVTAVVVALLSLGGLVLKMWPEIVAHFPHDEKPAIEAFTQPTKPKKKHRRVRHVIAPTEEESSNGESQAGN